MNRSSLARDSLSVLIIPRFVAASAAIAATALLVVACSGEGASLPEDGVLDDDGGATSAADASTRGTGDAAVASDSGDGGAIPGDASPDAAGPRGRSSGCGKTGAGTGLQSRTMTIGGKTRSYLRFIPATYDAQTTMAVVVGLHGSGGTSGNARSMFDMETPAAGKAIFIYPQGLPDPAYNGDNRWDPTYGSDDYTFLDAILSEAETTHCVERAREFIVGFSDGARMTSMVGCYKGDRFRAIAPVAPGGTTTTLPLAAGPCTGRVGIWEGVGDADTEHQPGAMIVRDYYRTTNGCSATRSATTPTGCEAYQGCGADTPSIWCTYPGGHAWPPIGSQGVWSFFDAFK